MTDWKLRQNPDGGWAYNKGVSWTEPTALVLLAQTAADRDTQSFQKGLNFLRATERADGGWSPQTAVQESTWVTALVSLLPDDALSAERRSVAVRWLKGQTGQESGWQFRLQQWLQGNKDKYPEGWPWFPGAAAWAIPTSLGILAFERAMKKDNDSELRRRVDTGTEFLLGRMCADGGWNHGSNRALGRDGDSYPETTGIALLALHACGEKQQMERAKAAARRHLATCKTAEGIAWLRMALAAHNEPATPAFTPVIRTVTDQALTALADAPHNPLLS